MTTPIKIVASRQVHGREILFIQSASYQGSAPVGGAFGVFDQDICCRTDPRDGRRLVDVVCQWQGDTTEDAMVTLELRDPVLQGCVGFAGEVVANIDYA